MTISVAQVLLKMVYNHSWLLQTAHINVRSDFAYLRLFLTMHEDIQMKGWSVYLCSSISFIIGVTAFFRGTVGEGPAKYVHMWLGYCILVQKVLQGQTFKHKQSPQDLSALKYNTTVKTTLQPMWFKCSQLSACGKNFVETFVLGAPYLNPTFFSRCLLAGTLSESSISLQPNVQHAMPMY